ncbi:MAG: hypothetical protein ACLFPA_12270 [Dichotomicrobium sp.]
MSHVRFGEVLEASNDKGPHKLVKIQSDGKEMIAEIWEPYGVQGSPPRQSTGLVLIPDGDEGKAVFIPKPPPKDRVDGQAEGEVTYKNHVAGQALKMDKDGNVTLELSGTFTVKAATFKVEADQDWTGDISHSGDYSQSGVHVDNNGPHTA